MAYAIIRSEKLKAKNIASAHAHNTRSMPVQNSSGATNENLLSPGADLESAVLEHIKNHAPNAQIRSTSVLAQELFLSASPEYFRPSHPEKAGYYEVEKMELWKKESFDFLKNRYGKNLISVDVHFDESTPHMHAIVVPVTKDGRLSARDVFDKKECLDYQTDYAKQLGHLGLKRGVKGSKATHEAVSRFYGAVNSPKPDAPAVPVPPANPFKSKTKWAEEQNRRLVEQTEILHAQATQTAFWKQRAADEKRARADMANKLETMKKTTAQLKDIELSRVLERLGYVVDLEKHNACDDQTQYRQGSEGGKYYGDRISVHLSGGKWFDHTNDKGSVGSIDLVMHAHACDFKNAKAWLIDQFGADSARGAAFVKTSVDFDVDKKHAVKHAPPVPAPNNISKVRDYLVNVRKLNAEKIDRLIDLKLIYADSRNNACFVYGDAKKSTGVELRGTYGKFNSFRGTKTATFKVPVKKLADIKKIVITESAIEALSYSELYPDHYAVGISGSGNHLLIGKLIDFARSHSKEVLIALNNDNPGQKAARSLVKECEDGGVKADIVRPWGVGHDWNDNLIAVKSELEKAGIGIDSMVIAERQAIKSAEYNKPVKYGYSRGLDMSL